MSFPVKGRVSQDFGPTGNTNEPTEWGQKDAHGWYRCRATQFAGSKRFEDFHPAVDIECPVGTPVRAPAAGTLARRSTYRIYNPYKRQYVTGRAIFFVFDKPVNGARGMYVDHLDRFVAVEGRHYGKDALLARSGDSGLSSGPHAHVQAHASATPQYDAPGFRYDPKRVFI
jgi:murein DD-endopeptidase MepM/ murein hydrolase activator NlpD